MEKKSAWLYFWIWNDHFMEACLLNSNLTLSRCSVLFGGKQGLLSTTWKSCSLLNYLNQCSPKIKYHYELLKDFLVANKSSLVRIQKSWCIAVSGCSAIPQKYRGLAWLFIKNTVENWASVNVEHTSETCLRSLGLDAWLMWIQCRLQRICL